LGEIVFGDFKKKKRSFYEVPTEPRPIDERLNFERPEFLEIDHGLGAVVDAVLKVESINYNGLGGQPGTWDPAERMDAELAGLDLYERAQVMEIAQEIVKETVDGLSS